MVRFKGVTKRYGALTVLDELDLDVARNEKVAIIGPSGSGKTTVLRMLMTLEQINEGVIEVDGEPLTHMTQQRRARAGRRAPSAPGARQDRHGVPALQPVPAHDRAAELHRGAGLRARPDQGRGRGARASELLDMVGLADKAGHYPGQLSGGQQQRVAIARALAMRPKVMLFDEVTSALDPELVGEVLNVIRKLGAEHDLTMLMVTHQMGFAREFADRVCFFYGGRILEDGPPEAIFGAPRTERTQQFLSAVLEAG